MIKTEDEKNQGIKLPACKINLFIAERLSYDFTGKTNIYSKSDQGELFSKIIPAEFDILKKIDPHFNDSTDYWKVGKKIFDFGKEPKPFAEIPLTKEITNLSKMRISDIVISVREYILDPEKMTYALTGDKMAFEIDYKNKKILLYELQEHSTM